MGGAGGNSGDTWSGGNGGNGGSGLILDAGHLDVSGTITGGAGGVGDGSNGAGGIGVNVARDKVTIVASGVISGGLNGDGVNRASAIAFAGGAKRLDRKSNSLNNSNESATCMPHFG